MLTTATKGATAKRGTSTLQSTRVTKKALPFYDSTQWIVFEKADDGNVKSPRLYPSNATRDNVRVHYSKNNKVSFNTTRAVRVKTYKNRQTKG